MLNVKIRVKGRIDEHWSSWFANLMVTSTDHGQTILSGTVVDQAELYGLLARLRDLGLPLVSVDSVEGKGEALSESGGDGAG